VIGAQDEGLAQQIDPARTHTPRARERLIN
jgi:hypothetical protein